MMDALLLVLVVGVLLVALATDIGALAVRWCRRFGFVVFRISIAEIVKQLTERPHQMPDDAIVYGWPNNSRPANADETINNDELMTNWAKTRLAIEVRVDPRNDGMLRAPPATPAA